jgi:hypothetical protein
MDDPIVQGIVGNALWAAIQRLLLFIFVRVVRVLKGKSPFRSIVICLKHRLRAHEEYYVKAFSSGRDVLYVSIMSHSTLKEDMYNYLESARRSKTHLRVLTWNPTDDSTIESFRQHLGEDDLDPQRMVTQVHQALADWKQLAAVYPDVITLREYKSSPSMQAVIVHEQWALVELMPYNAKPKERPALILRHKDDRITFEFFCERFEELWKDSERLCL